MSDTTCFLCGKKLTGYNMTRSWFIPLDVCKKFKICRSNSSDNKIFACHECVKAKGNRIMFPPIHADSEHSYLSEEHKIHLRCVQEIFSKLCNVVINGNKEFVEKELINPEEVPNYSAYWKRWMHDYKRIGTKSDKTSVFDKKKLYASSDLSHLK